MHPMIRRVLPLAVLALAAVGQPASADPKGDVVTIACDNGNTYSAVVKGNGDWTPAHDLASNTILVPTAFGESTFTITDSEGNVIDSETDPGSTKGHANKPRKTSTDCTFSFGGTEEDPDLGTLTFSATGTVSGFTTPARHAKG